MVGFLYTKVRHANQRYWGCTEDGWIELAQYKGQVGSGGVMSYKGEFWQVKPDESPSLLDNAAVTMVIMSEGQQPEAPIAPRVMWAHLHDTTLALCSHPAGPEPAEYVLDLHMIRPVHTTIINQPAIVFQQHPTIGLLGLSSAQQTALIDASLISDWGVPRDFCPIELLLDRPVRLYHPDAPDAKPRSSPEPKIAHKETAPAPRPPSTADWNDLLRQLAKHRPANDPNRQDAGSSEEEFPDFDLPLDDEPRNGHLNDILTEEEIANLGLEDVRIAKAPEDEPIPEFLLEKEVRSDSPYYQVERVYVPKPDEECGICMNEFEKTSTRARLICFCVYHEICISNWFKARKTPCCPTHTTAYAEAIKEGIIPPPPPPK